MVDRNFGLDLRRGIKRELEKHADGRSEAYGVWGCDTFEQGGREKCGVGEESAEGRL
jgi:hypothetical protein